MTFLKNNIAPLLAVSFVLAMLPLTSMPTFLLSAFVLIFLYCVLSLGWNFVGGYAGYASLGHSAFFGLGAYVVALSYKWYGLSPYVGAILGGIMAVVVALIIGYPTLRLRGAYFSIVTLALALLFQELFNAFPYVTGGGVGINSILLGSLNGINEVTILYWIFLGLFTFAAAMSIVSERSRFGFGLVAVREDEEAARAVGVCATRVKTEAFLISAFFTGLAGGFYAPYLTYVNPSIVFSVLFSFVPVLMVVIGGRGTWFGPIVGAFILAGLGRILNYTVLSELNLVIYGVLLVIVVVMWPDGIAVGLRRLALRKKGS